MTTNTGSASRQLTGVVRGVVRLLHDVCSHNAALERGNTAFHSTTIPPMTIADYMKRIYKYANCSEEAVVVALILIVRHAAAVDMPTCFYNIHRVLITAMLIAAKARDDEYYSNVYYGKIGGIQARELNSLEVFFLSALGWDMWVDEDEYEEVLRCCDPSASPGLGGAEGLQSRVNSVDGAAASTHCPSDVAATAGAGAAPSEAQLSEHFLSVVIPRIGERFLRRCRNFDLHVAEEKARLQGSFNSSTEDVVPRHHVTTTTTAAGGATPDDRDGVPMLRIITNRFHDPALEGPNTTTAVGGKVEERGHSLPTGGPPTPVKRGSGVLRSGWGSPAAANTVVQQQQQQPQQQCAEGFYPSSSSAPGLSSYESCTPPSTPTAHQQYFQHSQQQQQQQQAACAVSVRVGHLHHRQHHHHQASGELNSGIWPADPAAALSASESGQNSMTATPTRITTRSRFKGRRPSALPRNGSSGAFSTGGNSGTPTQFMSVYDSQQQYQQQQQQHSVNSPLSGDYSDAASPLSPFSQRLEQRSMQHRALQHASVSAAAAVGGGGGGNPGVRIGGVGGGGMAYPKGPVALATGVGYASGGHALSSDSGSRKQKRPAEWGDYYGD